MTKKTHHIFFFFALAAFALTFTLLYSKLSWLDDDGAFFLRYAVNMTKGAFWKYNINEAPIWGASAPLWPLLIAPFIRLGLPPVFSIHLVSGCCYVASTLLMTAILKKQFGLWIATLWIVFIGIEGRLLHFGISGLETPMTILVLSLAFMVLIFNIKNLYLIVLTITLIAIHKIDLIPFAAILFLTTCFQNKRLNLLSLILSSTLILAWYGFSWYYFGALVPNSFITKLLFQGHLQHIINHSWFIDFMLQSSKIGLALFFPSLYFSWKNNKYFTLFALSIIAIHATVYSLKPPFEPYNWYIMPTLYSYWVIIIFGLGSMLNNHKRLQPYCIIILAIFYLYYNLPNFVNGTRYMKTTANLWDQDRALAGVWVNEHTPPNTTVYTGWGLPAYYSQRYVYDFSFLNRHYEQIDLVLKYRPDILVLQGYTFGPYLKSGDCNHPNMENWKDYIIVKTFTEAYKADKNANYCFFIAKRKDFITN